MLVSDNKIDWCLFPNEVLFSTKFNDPLADHLGPEVATLSQYYCWTFVFFFPSTLNLMSLLCLPGQNLAAAIPHPSSVSGLCFSDSVPLSAVEKKTHGPPGLGFIPPCVHKLKPEMKMWWSNMQIWLISYTTHHSLFFQTQKCDARNLTRLSKAWLNLSCLHFFHHYRVLQLEGAELIPPMWKLCRLLIMSPRVLSLSWCNNNMAKCADLHITTAKIKQ